MSIRIRMIVMALGILSTIGAAASYVYAADGEKVPLATCNDGKTQYVPKERLASAGKGHVGACRGHKGVAKWADGSPVKAKGGTRSEYK